MSKRPPLDHLIPPGWLLRSGVSEKELDNWVSSGILIKIESYGGTSLMAFSGHSKPIKFKELAVLIQKAREQYVKDQSASDRPRE